MTVICNLNNLQKGIWWSEVRPNWAVLGSYNDALVGGEEEGEGYTNLLKTESLDNAILAFWLA